MREIKFRAWDKITGQMCRVQTIEGMTNNTIYELRDEGVVYHDRYEDEAILLQFTGLKDKNGKEIYEGDIVKNPLAAPPEDLGWEVIWNEPVAGYEFCRIRAGLDGGRETWMPNFDSVAAQFKVIGNIYENPELLKGGSHG